MSLPSKEPAADAAAAARSRAQRPDRHVLQPARPVSLTVISWLLILGAISTAYTAARSLGDDTVVELMSKSPIPVPLQYALLGAGAIVSAVSGIGILDGRAWARTLYLSWSGIGVLVSFTTSPWKLALVPSLLFFATIAFFLYRPRATAYLKSGGLAGVRDR